MKRVATTFVILLMTSTSFAKELVCQNHKSTIVLKPNSAGYELTMFVDFGSAVYPSVLGYRGTVSMEKSGIDDKGSFKSVIAYDYFGTEGYLNVGEGTFAGAGNIETGLNCR